MNIVVTGSGGQLGAELCKELGDQSIAWDRRSADLRDGRSLRQQLLKVAPDVVINCAAYTQVDRAEEDQDTCWAVNAEAVAVLAEACRDTDCTLVQISTDYVFGGPAAGRPRREDEPTRAEGVYAQSKLQGERNAARCPRHLIVRTCGLYASWSPGSTANNFVNTMLRLAESRRELQVVDDQFCTPSYVPHVAAAIRYLIEAERYGVYHVVNQGETTWCRLATELFRQCGLPVAVQPITTAQFGAPAPRPAYSVLDTSKYQSLGGPPLPEWSAALAEYLEARRAAGWRPTSLG